MDYKTVDPEFGSNEDLVDFIGHAHRRDMIVMMDLVLNHTADDHERVQ